MTPLMIAIPILLILDMVLYIVLRLNGMKKANEIELLIPFAWCINLIKIGKW